MGADASRASTEADLSTGKCAYARDELRALTVALIVFLQQLACLLVECRGVLTDLPCTRDSAIP
jgi:hypothetical protein